MQLDSRVIGRLDKSGEDNSHECNAHFKLEPGANPRVIELLTMLHQNAYILGGIGTLRVKELFSSILHQVLVGHKHRMTSHIPSKRVIEEATEYIKRHYMNPLTLEEMAELHAMSPKSFSYYFHKYTGVRPIDYLINYRIQEASWLSGLLQIILWN